MMTIKNTLKIGAVTGFLIIAATALNTKPVHAGTSVGETAASPRSLYVTHCARCHGSDGRSDTDKGRELDADDLTRSSTKSKSKARINAIISKGKGDMPGFSRKLTAAQIQSITGYIRTL